MPRIAKSGTTLIPKLQNLFLRSQEFDNVYWTKDATTNPTITANQLANPFDSGVTADLFTEGPGTGQHRIYGANITLLANLTYTYSIYVKDNTARYPAFTVDGTTDLWAIFDLNTGLLVASNFSSTFYKNVTFTIEAVGDGWYRISAIMTLRTDRVVFLAYSISRGPDISDISHAGTGKSLYIWQGQLVRANWAGFPTLTTSAAVTTQIRDRVASRSGVSGRVLIS